MAAHFRRSRAVYEQRVDIDLSALTPLAACPHSPDKVSPVEALAQAAAGPGVHRQLHNSSFADMMKVAAILKGRASPPG